MSITFVYRDENNKVQVKKIDYEEVKKDLMKYLSHDIRSIIKEKDVASIRIEYDQGDIKVFHGDDNIVLASWKEPDDVNDHWDDLWEYLSYMVVKYKGYRVGGI